MLTTPERPGGRSRPRQAVILAGGRGERMRPLTDRVPKPMIQVAGKPFLEHLLVHLREQGFERVLLLVGYLPNAIQDHFGNGSQFGLSIEYSVSDVDNDTGRRLKLAATMIEPCFLLMYCDNYWPMRMDDMWHHFERSGAQAQITVYRNLDGYTRDNVRVDADGTVAIYDKSRTSDGLQGVDMGFAILERAVLGVLPAANVSFEAVVYPHLVDRRQLVAYRTDHRYYSVGSLERLPVTERFLRREPVIILDRDGVLNRKPPRAEYVRTWEDFEWLPGAKTALRLLHEEGYRVVVVSNQAGIGRGVMSEQMLAAIHDRMMSDVEADGGRIDAIYHCPHDWNDGCECRKPAPGMLFQAQRDHHLDLSRTLFIGDDPRDEEAANAAGCPCALVSDDRSLLDLTTKLLNRSSIGVA